MSSKGKKREQTATRMEQMWPVLPAAARRSRTASANSGTGVQSRMVTKAKTGKQANRQRLAGEGANWRGEGLTRHAGGSRSQRRVRRALSGYESLTHGPLHSAQPEGCPGKDQRPPTGTGKKTSRGQGQS